MTFMCVLRLLPAPQNCFQSREQGRNFQRFLMMVSCVAFPAKVFCWTSVGIWCPDILKIYFILFVLKVKVMPG